MPAIAKGYEKRRGQCCGNCTAFEADAYGYGVCRQRRTRVGRWRRWDARVCRQFARKPSEEERNG